MNKSGQYSNVLSRVNNCSLAQIVAIMEPITLKKKEKTQAFYGSTLEKFFVKME